MKTLHDYELQVDLFISITAQNNLPDRVLLNQGSADCRTSGAGRMCGTINFL